MRRKRKPRRRLGSLPVRHTHEGRKAVARVFDLSRSVMNYAKEGKCGYAYDELREMYSADGEVKAHRASGADIERNETAVAHAEHVFSDHCTVVSRDKYYKAIKK